MAQLKALDEFMIVNGEEVCERVCMVFSCLTSSIPGLAQIKSGQVNGLIVIFNIYSWYKMKQHSYRTTMLYKATQNYMRLHRTK